MDAVLYILGLTDPSGLPYLFWSGIGTNLTIVGLIYRKLNCHETGCWRMGHYRHEHYMLCGKHHPRVKVAN